MSVQVARYADARVEPWRNGGGTTRVLLDDGGPDGPWTWRVSVAELQGRQIYSRYPGIQRVQLPLGPALRRLRINDVERSLDPVRGIGFCGEDRVEADSDGLAQVLNVMVARTDWFVQVQATTDPSSTRPGSVAVAVALEDGACISGCPLQWMDATRIDGMHPTSTGRFALAILRPRRAGYTFAAPAIGTTAPVMNPDAPESRNATI